MASSGYTEWRSRQPAFRGTDGLPLALGEYSLRWRDDQWHLQSKASSEPVGSCVSEARARMAAAHDAFLAVLPKRQVYFIGEAAKLGKPVKIGVSDDPVKRLRQLERGSPYPLRILATVEGDEDAERIYHAQFARLRQRGEWFKISKAILREIERLSA